MRVSHSYRSNPVPLYNSQQTLAIRFHNLLVLVLSVSVVSFPKVTESGGKEITMVDREKLNEQLRKLKKLIREDPEVKKIMIWTATVRSAVKNGKKRARGSLLL